MFDLHQQNTLRERRILSAPRVPGITRTHRELRLAVRYLQTRVCVTHCAQRFSLEGNGGRPLV